METSHAATKVLSMETSHAATKVMEISNGDFGASRDGLEAKLRPRTAALTHRCDQTRRCEICFKCHSGLLERSTQAAVKILYSLPDSYLSQRSVRFRGKKPMWELQWPIGAVSSDRCGFKSRNRRRFPVQFN
ncbi:hypothetical protein DY000_02004889 [Brassica cretica]|uniref:Uncharacterized protein n=1 Tax=Brassica cretica TaxID=69181 RepID=A0ABQ7CEG0_BRACR|nr:hypothetical protein DY000_02004889 [Brassica cretica]